MNQTRRLTTLALLVAVAAGLHYVESLLPAPLPVPGAKLGLANIPALLALITMGYGDAITLTLLRVLIGSLLGGTFLGLGFALSLAGGITSVSLMAALWRRGRTSLSTVGISVAGAVSHNLAQLAVFFAATGFGGVLYYAPPLVLLAVPTGFFVGVTVLRLRQKLQFSPHP